MKVRTLTITIFLMISSISLFAEIVEVNNDKIDKIRGMNITIVTTAETDEHSFELLNSIGFPFKRILQAKNIEDQT